MAGQPGYDEAVGTQRSEESGGAGYGEGEALQVCLGVHVDVLSIRHAYITGGRGLDSLFIICSYCTATCHKRPPISPTMVCSPYWKRSNSAAARPATTKLSLM